MSTDRVLRASLRPLGERRASPKALVVAWAMGFAIMLPVHVALMRLAENAGIPQLAPAVWLWVGFALYPLLFVPLVEPAIAAELLWAPLPQGRIWPTPRYRRVFVARLVFALTAFGLALHWARSVATMVLAAATQ